MEADEYSNFLTSILSLMTTRRWVPKDGKDGELVLRTVWQDDREVMRGHYAHRRQMGHARPAACCSRLPSSPRTPRFSISSRHAA